MIGRVCFSCLQKEKGTQLTDLFKNDVDGTTFLDKIKFVTDSNLKEIRNMEICKSCLEMLHIAYIFKKLVLQSQSKFCTLQKDEWEVMHVEEVSSENISFDKLESQLSENRFKLDNLVSECLLENPVTDTVNEDAPKGSPLYMIEIKNKSMIPEKFCEEIEILVNERKLSDNSEDFCAFSTELENEVPDVSKDAFSCSVSSCKFTETDMINGHLCGENNEDEEICNAHVDSGSLTPDAAAASVCYSISEDDGELKVESNRRKKKKTSSKQFKRKPKVDRKKGKLKKIGVSKLKRETDEKIKIKPEECDDEDGTETASYSCCTCELVFNKRWKLQKHVIRTHSQEKKFVCTYCNRGFKQSYHLREHITTHTGERNYTCHICGKAFQRLSSQRRHIKSHEAAPGQKTKRTPFLCTICGKSFPFSNGVQRHMRTHLGIKLHECTMCGRKFTQSTHLHVHMRTHTGEKPYICETCGEAFSLNAGLQKHMSAHKSGKEELATFFVAEDALS